MERGGERQRDEEMCGARQRQREREKERDGGLVGPNQGSNSEKVPRHHHGPLRVFHLSCICMPFSAVGSTASVSLVEANVCCVTATKEKIVVEQRRRRT